MSSQCEAQRLRLEGMAAAEGGGGSHVGASDEELDRLQAELEGAEETAANLEAELERTLELNREANDEKRRLKERADKLSKEIEFLRAENKRLMVEASGRDAGARLLDDEARRREIEEHRKKQALLSSPLAEHMKNVSALSTMKGRGPFKAPAFQLHVPNRWGEGGGRLKRGREGADWEDEGAADKRVRAGELHDRGEGEGEGEREGRSGDKENSGAGLGRSENGGAEDDGDWISLLENSNVRIA